MTFLQPWMLFALPIAALPIIIHLINRRRFQTTPWAAMMFLLAANRLSRGYTRVRRWTILALRTIVVAALIFVFTRPLATGPMAGGFVQRLTGASDADAIVLVDRSPSMQARGGGGPSKLESGLNQVSESLSTTGTKRLALVDSNSNVARRIGSPAQLLDSSATSDSDAAADIPAMLTAAVDHINDNELGQSEIWIVSDLRSGDWRTADPRWASIRESFTRLGRRVRFRVLAFPQPVAGNRSVRVEDVMLKRQDNESFVSLTIRVQAGADAASNSVPVTFEIDGARSIIDLPLSGEPIGNQGGVQGGLPGGNQNGGNQNSGNQNSGKLGELKNHLIPVGRDVSKGWGAVTIPTDGSPADDSHYFSFDTSAGRLTTIVSNDEQISAVLSLAAEISSDESIAQQSQVIAPEAAATIPWDRTTLLLWNADLPAAGDETATQIKSFVDRGGRVIFFPPKTISNDSMLGVRYTEWQTAADDVSISRWRGESDLLAASAAGAALPVGDLGINRHAGIDGSVTVLAALTGDVPLLAKVPTDRGGVYFCGTTPNASDSSLAADGVVLYVMIQRALAAAATAMGNTRDVVAGGSDPDAAAGWVRLAGRDGRLSSDYAFDAGVYTAGDRMFAVNRPAAEDDPAVVGDPQLAELLAGLNWVRVDRTANESSSLFEEIWRIFLISMLIAMLVEAALCLPKSNSGASLGNRPAFAGVVR